MALLRAHALSGRANYRERARRLLERYEAASARNFFGFAQLLAARDFDRLDPVIVTFEGEGEALQSLRRVVHRAYLPARVLAHARDVPVPPGLEPPRDGAGSSGAAAFVCRAGVCLAPVAQAADLRRALGLAAAPA
jgi:hypothetical protein